MQYILIHDAIIEAFYTGKTEIEASGLSNAFGRLRSLTSNEIKKQFDVCLCVPEISN